uniref:Transposase IS30-like HTH domain-containing protein n=1 Tax=Globisporangium ultimum (strain ATCC 200006 / CBS 805.95 / DAOM BR144) TaxID=431595 RepID=K3X2E6_GLOUD
MAKGKFLTDEERDTIRSLAANGIPLRTIAAAVKRSLEACQRVVSTPAKNQPQKHQGSPQSVTEREKRQIIKSVSVGTLSAAKVKEKLQLACVIKAVDWLKYRKINATPALTKRHKEARVRWAEEMVLFNGIEWCQMVFSNEKKWNLNGPDGM